VFRDAGVSTKFIGHPLVGNVQATDDRAAFYRRNELDPGLPLVTILPGSRNSELGQHMPILLESIAEISRDMKCHFVIAAAHPGDVALLQAQISSLPASIGAKVVEGQTYNALAAADAAIVSSGTATVEAALLNTPMVVVYRVSPLTAALAKPLVRTKFFAMVNLIAGRLAVPELIQKDFTGPRAATEILRLLGDPQARSLLRVGLEEVRQRLGPPGAVERAADGIVNLLTKGKSNA